MVSCAPATRTRSRSLTAAAAGVQSVMPAIATAKTAHDQDFELVDTVAAAPSIQPEPAQDPGNESRGLAAAENTLADEGDLGMAHSP